MTTIAHTQVEQEAKRAFDENDAFLGRLLGTRRIGWSGTSEATREKYRASARKRLAALTYEQVAR